MAGHCLTETETHRSIPQPDTPKQIYARIYDETLYEQFKTAMSRLEAIAVDDWPDVDISMQVLKENRTAGPAQRFNVANSVRFG